MTVSGERLITVKEASEILNVPRSWVYAKVESPECDLPHFKIGRYHPFPRVGTGSPILRQQSTRMSLSLVPVVETQQEHATFWQNASTHTVLIASSRVPYFSKKRKQPSRRRNFVAKLTALVTSSP